MNRNEQSQFVVRGKTKVTASLLIFYLTLHVTDALDTFHLKSLPNYKLKNRSYGSELI